MILKMKTSFSIMIVVWLVCSFFVVKETAFAEEAKVEVLIVIDKSGSLKDSEISVKQAAEMLESFLESEFIDESIDAIAFADEAEFVKLNEIEMDGDYTNVLAALKEADKWVEEKLEQNKKSFVVFISDLVAERKNGYPPNHIIKMQKSIDKIIEEWDSYLDEKGFDYLFVTWNTENKQNPQNVESVENINTESSDIIYKFICEIDNQDKVYCLKEDEKADKGKNVSDVFMTGKMLRRLIEDITDMPVKRNEPILREKEWTISKSPFFEAYVVMENNATLAKKTDSNTYEELKPIYTTDTMQLYHFGMDMNQTVLYVKPEGVKQCNASIFYIPIDIGIYTERNNKKEGEEMEFSCKMDKEYVRSQLKDGVKLEVYKMQEDNSYVQIHLEDDNTILYDGTSYSALFQENGNYKYEVKTMDGYILEENVFTISHESISESESWWEKEKKSLFIGGIVILLGIGSIIVFRRE